MRQTHHSASKAYAILNSERHRLCTDKMVEFQSHTNWRRAPALVIRLAVFAQGETIVSAGDDADRMYIVSASS